MEEFEEFTKKIAEKANKSPKTNEWTDWSPKTPKQWLAHNQRHFNLQEIKQNPDFYSRQRCECKF